MKKIQKILFSVGVLLFIAQCATNPVTGRRELSFISEAKEIQMGATYYGPTIQSFDGKYMDDRTQAIFNRVGQKMAKLSHRPNLKYEFTVVNTSVVNAFALPGGKICITRGLLQHMTSESQLAAVTGHEIGHVTARHSVRQMTRQLLLGGLLTVGALALESQNVGGRGAMVQAGAIGLQALLSKYSRGQESQSDRLGMGYMTKAGYDPQGAVELFQIFEGLQTRKANFIEKMFASHPQSRDRVSNAETRIAANYQAIAKDPNRIVNSDDFKYLSAKLKKEKPSYDEYDKGVEASSNKLWLTAIRHFNKAIEGKPQEALFHADLGFAYLQSKQMPLAETHIKKSIGLYPGFFKPNYYMGYLEYERKNYSEARRHLYIADQLVPGNPLLKLMLGESSEIMGDKRTAVANYKFVYQIDRKGKLGATARGHLERMGVMKKF